MTVMSIGDVSMIVGQGRLLVAVGVRLVRFVWSVVVLMMLVVRVEVLVLQHGVRVPVRVAFSK